MLPNIHEVRVFLRVSKVPESFAEVISMRYEQAATGD
jgi:hypothetical protein